MSVGLTLGKFAPLHHGHQYLIDTALAENDQVVVLIYETDVIDIPLRRRADWIRQLYPQVEVIECYDGPQQVGDSPEIMRLQEDYALRQLAGRRIDRFYSSEFYGAHMSLALAAEDRRLDSRRQRFPVSGTQVRANPYAYRHLLHPLVYRDLVCNVVLLGAPSSGKTTLCAALATAFDTCWMPEYGREYWEQHQVARRLTPEQLVAIAEGHLQREDACLLQANRYLFTDTNAFTTWQFCRAYHEAAPARLEQLATDCWQRYQQVLVCDIDIPYEDTWDRSGVVARASFQADLLAELVQRDIAYTILSGELSTRIDQVRRLLTHTR